MDDVKQNIVAYFDVLQVEYLVSEIRCKIYPASSDKRYYNRVMGQKEAKIKDISIKNSLPSIFNSEKVRNSYISRIYNVKGLPNFGKYQLKTDITNYYSVHSTVKVYEDEKADLHNFIVGTITAYNKHRGVVTVYLGDGTEKEAVLNLVTRFL